LIAGVKEAYVIGPRSLLRFWIPKSFQTWDRSDCLMSATRSGKHQERAAGGQGSTGCSQTDHPWIRPTSKRREKVDDCMIAAKAGSNNVKK
jgi:hypothetical protein